MRPSASPTVTKIERLIALAVGSTFPEEARSSALVAVKLIASSGFVLHDPAEARALPPGWRVILSRFAAHCRVCGDSYDEGESVAWQRGKGAVHVACLAGVT